MAVNHTTARVKVPQRDPQKIPCFLHWFLTASSPPNSGGRFERRGLFRETRLRFGGEKAAKTRPPAHLHRPKHEACVGAESLDSTLDASGKCRSVSQRENTLAGVLRGRSLSDHMTVALWR